LIFPVGVQASPGEPTTVERGLILDKALVKVMAEQGLVQAELDLYNHLSSAVDQIEVELSCSLDQTTDPWIKRGSRPLRVMPKEKMTTRLLLKAPTSPVSRCTVKLLGYRVETPTGDALFRLLLTGLSADERAAVLSAGNDEASIKFLELNAFTPTKIDGVEVVDVRFQLLAWYAVATARPGKLQGLDSIEGIENFDQPLQIVLTARDRGSVYTSPIAFLIPDNLSTMKQVLNAFKQGAISKVELLEPFVMERPVEPAPEKPEDTWGFYKKLSFGLIIGILLWTIWSWFQKRRLGVSKDV